MLGLPLAFAAPMVLVALAALPALYFLLRVTPPPPKRIPLPTIPLVKDLVTPERQPARTPWWLLMLRLALAAAAILALAGPLWNPPPVESGAGRGPLVLMIDNGWGAAPDWVKRRDRAIALIEAATDRPVVLRAASEDAPEPVATTARTAIERLRGLQPVPHSVDRTRQFAAILAYAEKTPQAEVLWLSDRMASGTPDEATRDFLTRLGSRLRVIADEKSPVRAVVSASNDRESMIVKLARPESQGSDTLGVVRALDTKGRPLGEATFDFAGQTRAEARIAVPLEVRNDISRLEIADGRSAASVLLLDAGAQRRKVALISGETADTNQPLISGTYFVTKALAPYSALSEAPRGISDPVGKMLTDRPEVMVLVDVGTISGATLDQITAFVEEGGVLIRFAGSGLAASSDSLLPVRLRRGGRVLGGALSWEKPQRLASYPATSPFAGLPVPADVQIDRQVLAEPDPTLNERTWASLTDGTPLVTAQRRGKGLLVLFHVTADTSWSSLPLSGVFVDMLRRILPLAVASGEARDGGKELANPRRALDGFGAFASPPATAKAVARSFAGPATAEHPPGFYGPPEATLAVNTLAPDTALPEIDYGAATRLPLDIRPPVDLRPPLLVLAFLLFLVDALAVAALAGLFSRDMFRRAATVLALAGLGALAVPQESYAQNAAQPTPQQRDIEASLKTRLAYIVTGNREVDETSRLGLETLTRALTSRTAFEPGAPVGLDPAKDEMVFYSLVYWPITPDQPMPGEAALRRIDQFMKNGGTMIFDTRDATAIRGTGGASAETRRLRQMLASLDIPDIEEVPRDHVLTKTFYLLDKIVGRYAQGETWVEAIPRGASDEKRPARAGDRVSPVVITSTDLAAAWALDRNGQPRYPMVPNEPRQREMALRAGINLAMYAMTGNYKADQVHVPALLDRLGQ